jgi:hypothetical protein
MGTDVERAWKEGYAVVKDGCPARRVDKVWTFFLGGLRFFVIFFFFIFISAVARGEKSKNMKKKKRALRVNRTLPERKKELAHSFGGQ